MSRETIALDKPPAHKTFKELRVEFHKKINECVLSHTRIYLDYDDQKPVDFIGEFKTFACQLNKIRVRDVALVVFQTNQRHKYLFTPSNRTEELLLPTTKKCAVRVEQVHTKPEEALEKKHTLSTETFSLKEDEWSWMIVLTIYKYSIVFIVTQKK